MVFRKRLANPQESCGSEIPREITASRVRRTVWWPRGVAKQVFVTEIRPELNIVLEHTGLGYADIFISVFMIGSRPNSAVPTIMVSCLSKSVRDEAVKAIKRSNVLQDHPEFHFGASALPLNEPAPSQSLGSPEPQSSAIFQLPASPSDDYRDRNPTDTAPQTFLRQVEQNIMGTDSRPSIGRQLFLTDPYGKKLRSTTGGVIIRIGNFYYQRTVGHIDEKEEKTLVDQSQDLDYCDLEEDTDSDDEVTGHPPDHEVTSRGSLSPAPERRSFGGSSDAESDPDAVMTEAPTSTFGPNKISPAYSHPHNPARHHQSDSYLFGVLKESPAMVNVGQLRHHSRDGAHAYLDYSLVSLGPFLDLQSVNKTEIKFGGTTKSLRVRTVGQIQDVETDIIVVTASNGTTRGRLIPSAVYLKSTTHPSLEELFVVHLQGQIMSGDCGADVLDAETGDLYGHVVRGCPGTQIAYIRAATDVFQDIQQRLGTVPVVASDEFGTFGPGRTKPIAFKYNPSIWSGGMSNSISSNTAAESMVISTPETQVPRQEVPSTAVIHNASQQVILACPFAKKDPIIHGRCHNYELREIKHVKQHLKRCHLIFICPRCKEGFPSQGLVNDHLLRGCKLRHLRDPDGMTPRQHETLNARTNHKVSLEEQWYFIWDVLFPGLPRPVTPYKDEFPHLREFHKVLTHFRNHHLPSVADRILHQIANEAPMSQYDQTVFIASRALSEFNAMLLNSGGSQSVGSWNRPPAAAPVPATSRDSTHHSTGFSHDSGYYSTNSAQNLYTPLPRPSRSALDLEHDEESQPENPFGAMEMRTDEVLAMFPMAAYGLEEEAMSRSPDMPHPGIPMSEAYRRSNAYLPGDEAMDSQKQ